MKKIKFLVVLSVFVCSASFCYGDSSNPQSSFVKRLNVSTSTPEAMAERANKGTYYGAQGGIQDPLINGAIGGYYNMMQVMQGLPGSSFGAQEMQKQQTDYVRQQMNNPTAKD